MKGDYMVCWHEVYIPVAGKIFIRKDSTCEQVLSPCSFLKQELK